MLSLSEERGRPIAIIHGGEFDGDWISILEDENDFDSEEEPEELLTDPKFFEIEEGELYPLPDLTGRQVTYIAGPSGSGKSTYASKLAIKYGKAYPGNFIYIFSRLDKDPAFDGKIFPKPIRVPINESLLSHPIDITKQMKGGCLVIFDDIDTIIDDKLKKAVQKLQNDILEIGRHNNVHIICCSHLINGNDKKISRTMLNEAHSLTFFPKSGSTYQITYCLKNYFGLSKKQIEMLLNLDSRWVTILKGYPQTVIWSNGVMIL